MKNSKKILIVAMSMIMIIATIIPSFAYIRYGENFTNLPDDASVNIDMSSVNYYDNMIHKVYLYLEFDTNMNIANNIRVYYNYVDSNQEIKQGSFDIAITHDGKLTTLTSNTYEYTNIMLPLFTMDLPNRIYIPLYIYNANIRNVVNVNVTSVVSVMFYSTLTLSQEELINQAYSIGYNSGYDNGYTNGIVDSAGYQQDLNLVEHCEQLIGTFVGDDYAHYITPLCLALVVILIYFLFIRWLLALVKSKNVTRVADIIVCTACIIMLVIMYAPMLDLTIKQAQTVYQISADTIVGG